MILYLIRHGKTDAHLLNKRQSPDTPLGELGKKQAMALAAKMNLLKVDHLYSSEWPRALQTAQFLSESFSLPIKTHPFVHEIKKHPKLNGIPEDSELNMRAVRESRENMDNFDWKFEGQGESVNEIIARAKIVIEYLEKNHPNESVAIVSHGVFIMIMTSLILLGQNYDQRSFRKLSRSLKMHNTGVSSFKFDPSIKQWTMICFNDHGHLEHED